MYRYVAILFKQYSGSYNEKKKNIFFYTHATEIYRKNFQPWSSNPRRLRRSRKLPVSRWHRILQKPDLRLKSAQLVIPIKFSLYGTSIALGALRFRKAAQSIFFAAHEERFFRRGTRERRREERDARRGATRCNSGL